MKTTECSHRILGAANTFAYDPGYEQALVPDESVQQFSHHGKRSFLLRWGFATLCAALILTARSSLWAITNEEVLYNFCSTQPTHCLDGANPSAGLFIDSAGDLYGTTENGGIGGNGLVFRLSPVGCTPQSPNLWCETQASFNRANGAFPVAALTSFITNTGELFGTTRAGGASTLTKAGTVFEVDLSGSALLGPFALHSFNGTNGAFPTARLATDVTGNLYGTTQSGGHFTKGEVFRLNIDGQTVVLHQFGGKVGGKPDGANPFAGLVPDGSGNFFGTTNAGGASNRGVVFMISATGSYQIIHNFGGLDSNGTADGANPQGDLALDSGTPNLLYGTTQNGGKYNRGTVFQLSTTGNGPWVQTVLHSFKAGADGAGPLAGVIQDSEGNLFGTASGGNSGSGVVFKVFPPNSFSCNPPAQPDPWCESTVWAFPGQTNDGLYPRASLIADTNGNLFATTYGGGRWGEGVVFRLNDTGFVP